MDGRSECRVGKLIKPGLKKTGFYYWFFSVFFQMDFAKTRVFSVFFKFFGKKLTKTAKFEKKMKPTAFFIKIHVFWVGMAEDYQRRTGDFLTGTYRCNFSPTNTEV